MTTADVPASFASEPRPRKRSGVLFYLSPVETATTRSARGREPRKRAVQAALLKKIAPSVAVRASLMSSNGRPTR
jgi:hypothetical protein